MCAGGTNTHTHTYTYSPVWKAHYHRDTQHTIWRIVFFFWQYSYAGTSSKSASGCSSTGSRAALSFSSSFKLTDRWNNQRRSQIWPPSLPKQRCEIVKHVHVESASFYGWAPCNEDRVVLFCFAALVFSTSLSQFDFMQTDWTRWRCRERAACGYLAEAPGQPISSAPQRDASLCFVVFRGEPLAQNSPL